MTPTQHNIWHDLTIFQDYAAFNLGVLHAKGLLQSETGFDVSVWESEINLHERCEELFAQFQKGVESAQ